MAQTFNIIAKIQLQGPANLRPVVNSIQQQLSGINARVNVQLPPGAAKGVSSIANQFSTLNTNVQAVQVSAKTAARVMGTISMSPNAANVASTLNANLRAATASTQALGKGLQSASTVVEKFGERVGLAARYFVAFQLGAVFIGHLQRVFSDATKEALQFNKTMASLSQIGATSGEIGAISQQITSLSKGLGVASKDLAETTIALKGAGLTADEMRASLEALAKTSLTPTFKSIQNTSEGLIALRQQFGASAGDFERYLGSINTVARQFAAESEDLVTAIRRAGGAFKAASNDATTAEQSFQQFISIFTSIRATTRESADEISTGLRTIFARLQSTQVADQLKGLGISLRYTGEEARLAGKNIEGQFVGAWEAVKRLQEAVKGVPTTDPRFAEIVKQIGGFRQISRVIPLLQQSTLQQKAYATAQAGSNSLTQDANKIQGVFLVRITKVKEEFNDLIRALGESKTIRTFGDAALGLASSLISLTKALIPLIPLLTTFAAIKIGRSIFQGTSTFLPSVARGFTQPVTHRQMGGPVPGHGSGDIVPAMLEPGEFVINKRAAKRIGHHKLANIDRYATGGKTKYRRKTDIESEEQGIAGLIPVGQAAEPVGLVSYASQGAFGKGPRSHASSRTTLGSAGHERDNILLDYVHKLYSSSGREFKRKEHRADPKKTLGRVFSLRGSVHGYKLNAEYRKKFDKYIETIEKNPELLAASEARLKQDQPNLDFNHLRRTQRNSWLGYELEEFLGSELGVTPSRGQASFDLPRLKTAQRTKLSRMVEDPQAGLHVEHVDAKFTADSNRYSSVLQKAAREAIFDPKNVQDTVETALKNKELFRRVKPVKRKGGGVVPALLEPGEWVYNKKEAQIIGYDKLHKLNRQHLASGGRLQGLAKRAGINEDIESQVSIEHSEGLDKHGIDTRKALNAAGVLPGSKVSLRSRYPNLAVVKFSHPKATAHRTVYFDDKGDVRNVINADFKATSHGRGAATHSYARQLIHGRPKSIGVEAVGDKWSLDDKGASGYYVWPTKFGADGKISYLAHNRLSKSGLLPANMSNNQDLKVSDILSLPNGEAIWKEYGDSFDGNIDTGSRQVRKLIRKRLVSNIRKGYKSGGQVNLSSSKEDIRSMMLEHLKGNREKKDPREELAEKIKTRGGMLAMYMEHRSGGGRIGFQFTAISSKQKFNRSLFKKFAEGGFVTGHRGIGRAEIKALAEARRTGKPYKSLDPKDPLVYFAAGEQSQQEAAGYAVSRGARDRGYVLNVKAPEESVKKQDLSNYDPYKDYRTVEGLHPDLVTGYRRALPGKKVQVGRDFIQRPHELGKERDLETLLARYNRFISRPKPETTEQEPDRPRGNPSLSDVSSFLDPTIREAFQIKGGRADRHFSRLNEKFFGGSLKTGDAKRNQGEIYDQAISKLAPFLQEHSIDLSTIPIKDVGKAGVQSKARRTAEIATAPQHPALLNYQSEIENSGSVTEISNVIKRMREAVKDSEFPGSEDIMAKARILANARRDTIKATTPIVGGSKKEGGRESLAGAVRSDFAQKGLERITTDNVEEGYQSLPEEKPILPPRPIGNIKRPAHLQIGSLPKVSEHESAYQDKEIEALNSKVADAVRGTTAKVVPAYTKPTAPTVQVPTNTGPSDKDLYGVEGVDKPIEYKETGNVDAPVKAAGLGIRRVRPGSVVNPNVAKPIIAKSHEPVIREAVKVVSEPKVPTPELAHPESPAPISQAKPDDVVKAIEAVGKDIKEVTKNTKATAKNVVAAVGGSGTPPPSDGGNGDEPPHEPKKTFKNIRVKQPDLDFIDAPPLFPAHPETKPYKASLTGDYPLGFENSGISKETPTVFSRRPLVPSQPTQLPINIEDVFAPKNLGRERDQFDYSRGGSYAFGERVAHPPVQLPVPTASGYDIADISHERQHGIPLSDLGPKPSVDPYPIIEEIVKKVKAINIDDVFAPPDLGRDNKDQFTHTQGGVYPLGGGATVPQATPTKIPIGLSFGLAGGRPESIAERRDRLKKTYDVVPTEPPVVNPIRPGPPLPGGGRRPTTRPDTTVYRVKGVAESDTEDYGDIERPAKPEAIALSDIQKTRLEANRKDHTVKHGDSRVVPVGTYQGRVTPPDVIPLSKTTHFAGPIADSNLQRRMEKIDLQDLGVIPSNVAGKISDQDLLSVAVGGEEGRDRLRSGRNYGSTIAPEPTFKPKQNARGFYVHSDYDPKSPDFTKSTFYSQVSQDVFGEPFALQNEPRKKEETKIRERIGLFGKVHRTEVPAKSSARLRAEDAVRQRRTQPVERLSAFDRFRGRTQVAGGDFENLADTQRKTILEQAEALFADKPDLINQIREGQADVTLSRSGNVVGAQNRATNIANVRKRAAIKGTGSRGLGVRGTARKIGTGLKNFATGQSGIPYGGAALSAAAFFAPTLLENQFGTVDKPAIGKTREAAAHAQAVGSGLQTGAVGAQVGLLAGGPIGAAIGGVAGALIGFTNTLKEQQNRIKELDFEKSFKSFQVALEDIANDKKPLDQRARGQISAGIANVDQEAQRSVEFSEGGLNRDTKRGFSNFFDADFFRTTVGSKLKDIANYEVGGGSSFSIDRGEEFKKTAKAQSDKRIELLSPQLPAFHQIGQKIASNVKLTQAELTPNANISQSGLAALKEQRLEKFKSAGGAQIAQTISEIQKIPLEQVYEQFDGVIRSANTLRIQEEAAAKSVAEATIQLHKFAQIEQAVNAAASSLHGLQTQADHLSDSFHGNLATSRVGNFSEAAGQIGGLDQAAFGRSLDFVGANVGGGTGAEFTGLLRQVDTAMRNLPAAISSSNLDFSSPETLKSGLSGLLGKGEGNLGLPSEIQDRLSTAIEAFDPERLFKETTSNPKKLVDDLIRDAFGDLNNVLTNVTKGIEDNFNRFGVGLNQYGKLLQEQGESLDRLSSGRLGAQRASANLRAARTGRDASDFLSLDDLRRPFADRQRRLAGGDAFNPTRIAERATAASGRVTAIQAQLEQATHAPDARENAARINELQNEFARATSEASALQQALHNLADASDETASIQEKLNDIEKQRQGQLSFTEKLLTANPQQRRDIAKGANLSDVAASQGNFAGFNADQISRVLEHLRSLQDVKLPGYGNRTGGQVADVLLTRANRVNFGRQAEGLDRGRDQLLQQQGGVADTAVKAQEEIAKLQAETAKQFIENLSSQNKQFLDKMDSLIKAARLSDTQGAQQRAAIAVQRSQGAVEGVNTAEKISGTNIERTRSVLNDPQFANLRTAEAQVRSFRAGREAINTQLHAERTSRGTVFGAKLDNIKTTDDKHTAIDKLNEQLPKIREAFSAQTGLSHDQFNEHVAPNLLKQIEDYFKTPAESRALEFNTGRGLISATHEGFGVAQSEAQGRATEARRTIGINTFGAEGGALAPNQAIITNLLDNFEKLNQVLSSLPQGINSVNDAAAELERNVKAKKTADEAVEKAGGKATGGIMFSPRGTDTVPAMLTPGEFVVNAAATRANLSMLQDINAARGPVYRAIGGRISPEDRINDTDAVLANLKSKKVKDVKAAIEEAQKSLDRPDSGTYNSEDAPVNSQKLVRRYASLDRLRKEVAGHHDEDELSVHPNISYNQLLTADQNAKETTQLSTEYNPLTRLDRAIAPALNNISNKLFPGATLSDIAPLSIATGGQNIATVGGKEIGLPTFGHASDDELNIRRGQQRERLLSDPEKQRINVAEAPVDFGIDYGKRGERRIAATQAEASAQTEAFTKQVEGIRSRPEAAPVSEKALEAKRQTDALLAQRAAADEASHQRGNEAARLHQVAKQRRESLYPGLHGKYTSPAPISETSVADGPQVSPALRHLPKAIRDKILAADAAKASRQAQFQEGVQKGQKLDEARAARHQTNVKSLNLNLASIPPVDNRQGIPNRNTVGTSKSNKKYFDYFEKAIDFYGDKKGKDISSKHINAAARNQRQLQAHVGHLIRSGGSQESIERGKDLLSKFAQSGIGQTLDVTQRDRAEFNLGPLGGPQSGPDDRVTNTVLRRKKLEVQRANRLATIKKTKASQQLARKLRPRHRFAEGGLVPAMVSPGEFIVNRESALANSHILNHINSGRSPVYRAGGGTVGPTTGAGGGASPLSLGSDVKSTLDGFVSGFSNVVASLADPTDKLKTAADTFSNIGRSLDGFSQSASSLADRLGGFNDAATSLAKSLASVSIPPKIEMSVNGNYNVVLNGGNIFSTMTKAVAEEVKNAILQQLGGQIQKAIAEAPPR